ncbi:MAG: amino acid decarboxylase, partial [Candidatus Dormibacteraeota bacterium]|nr:amino acid decarboxylase [Candidatus Dormibacteraeota bacterium]
VAAGGGTVATGAVDPLDEIAEVCAAEDLWFHVDGAYGGFGVLDEGVTPRFRGLERADSLALDPHKWLSVPVECGAILVRDAAAMRAAFSLVPAYLRTEPEQGFGGLPWFSEFGFQQTRGFRALKLWMVLAASGREGVAAHIRHGIRLARELADRVRAAPDLELFGEPPLSIVCFRHRGSDDLNRSLMHRLQEEGRVFVTQAELESRFWLRACILGDATRESDLAALVDEVRRLGAQLEERE